MDDMNYYLEWENIKGDQIEIILLVRKIQRKEQKQNRVERNKENISIIMLKYVNGGNIFLP